MILHRYIYSQIIWPIVAIFLSLNLLFLVIQILKVAEIAVGAGLGIHNLLSVAVLFLPEFAVFTIPISVLTGVLLGFGRLAADGELVALATAGVPGSRLLLSPLLVGLVAGLAALAIGMLAPASTALLRSTFVDLSKRYVNARLKPGTFFDELPGVVMYPRRGSTSGDVFEGFLMFDRRPGRPRHILVASQARVQPLDRANYLHMQLEDGEIHACDRGDCRYSLAEFSSATVGIDIDHLVSHRTRFISSIQDMSLSELDAAARDSGLSRRQRNLCASAWHRRFAFPLASLLFALLGAGMGAMGKLQGRQRNLLASVAAVAGYYVLMRFGDALVGKDWLDPGTAAWFPNLLVLGVIVWLVGRGRRPG